LGCLPRGAEGFSAVEGMSAGAVIRHRSFFVASDAHHNSVSTNEILM